MEDKRIELDAVCLAARIILENGGETYRAEDTVAHMCAGFRIPQVDVLALPTGLMLTMETAEAAAVSRIVRVSRRATDLKRIDECNDISRRVSAGSMNAEEALESLKKIRSGKTPGLCAMLLAGAFSSAFFTVMLGGSILDFCVCLLVGAAVQLILPLFSRHQVPVTVSGLMAGFIATLATLCAGLIFPALHIEPILSGAIMPLLPGLATTNAIRDTIRGDLVSGGARITEAALSALMLAAGICIALSAWGGVIK